MNKLALLIPVAILIVGIMAIVIAEREGNCTWEIITSPTIELSYGYPTETNIKNNVLLINFLTSDIVNTPNLEVPIIENETDLDGINLSRNLILQYGSSGGVCTWIEREEDHFPEGSLIPDGKVLITKVNLGGDSMVDFESRVWRNKDRLDNSDTLMPAGGNL